MARQLHQLASVQEAFAARIAQKVAEQRDKVQDRAEDVPLLGWLLKPIAGFAFDREEASNARKGERGEERAPRVGAQDEPAAGGGECPPGRLLGRLPAGGPLQGGERV